MTFLEFANLHPVAATLMVMSAFTTVRWVVNAVERSLRNDDDEADK